MRLLRARPLFLAAAVLALGGCERAFEATPEERVGLLRELVRARTVSRDTLPIDACSVDRFMEGVPAWRDSLVAAERAMLLDAPPCPAAITPVHGRFVLTSWHRNWSGEYVIRGAAYPWDQGYRFTDGIYVGLEQTKNQEFFAGRAEPPAPSKADSGPPGVLRGDSIRRAGTVAESASEAGRDSSARRTTPGDSSAGAASGPGRVR